MSPSTYEPPGGRRVPGRPDGEFSGPILSGQVYIPSRKDKHKRGRRRRSRGSKILRWLLVVVVFILVLAGAAWGYNQYQWSQVASQPCATCVAAANGAPYNVLLIGSDSRAGITGSQAQQQFGTASQAPGQRSDTIKIVHVDPQAGTARTLSIPRDTYVRLSGLPAGTGLSTDNKINSAFNNGPDGLIKTIENTFGIPISHYIVINFTGVQDAVNALGGISLNFPYPARDNDNGNNNSGLSIPTAGCQVLNGPMALALSRSRYYQYYTNGYWHQDGTGDLGRITRQNIVIAAVLNKAKSTYNPLKLNSLLGSMVHDFSKDDGLTEGDLFSLVERYHAFGGSSLQAYTLPTVAGTTSGGSSVEVVDEPAAQQTLAAFLGTTPNAVSTPPLDAYGSAIAVPAVATAPTTPATAAPNSSATTPTTAPVNQNPSFDPTPC
ncbi:MAG TPA: LCP family protein [Acidimicrobiales bacterium]|nr:LCP family protein [Acidimicrobiales bacterium]